jgi:hypothetical protein
VRFFPYEVRAQAPNVRIRYLDKCPRVTTSLVPRPYANGADGHAIFGRYIRKKLTRRLVSHIANYYHGKRRSSTMIMDVDEEATRGTGSHELKAPFPW